MRAHGPDSLTLAQYRAHPPSVRVHSSFRAPKPAPSSRSKSSDSTSSQGELLRGWGGAQSSAGAAAPSARSRSARRSTVGRFADAVRGGVSAMSRGLVSAEASAEEASAAEAGAGDGGGSEETARHLRRQESVATAEAEVERVPTGCRCEVAAVRFRSRVPGWQSQGAPPFSVRGREREGALSWSPHHPSSRARCTCRAHIMPRTRTAGRSRCCPGARAAKRWALPTTMTHSNFRCAARRGVAVRWSPDARMASQTKQPVWDPGFKRYVLDYGRRACLHSKQNCVLQPSVRAHTRAGGLPSEPCARA